MAEHPDVPGADQVIRWFGYWPDFHDAEVLLDGFLMDRERISRMRIERFNYQNVLSNLSVTRLPDGYSLVLDGIFGVDASIDCERLTIRLEPGIPHDGAKISSP